MGDQKKGWWPRARALVLPRVAWGLGLVPACRASASPSARQLDPCDPGNLAMPGQVLVAKERPVLPPMPTTPWVPLGTAGAQLSRGLSSACPSHMPSSPVPRKSPKASTSAGSLEKLIQGRERRAWNQPRSPQRWRCRAPAAPRPKGSQDVRGAWPRLATATAMLTAAPVRWEELCGLASSPTQPSRGHSSPSLSQRALLPLSTPLTCSFHFSLPLLCLSLCVSLCLWHSGWRVQPVRRPVAGQGQSMRGLRRQARQRRGYRGGEALSTEGSRPARTHGLAG